MDTLFSSPALPLSTTDIMNAQLGQRGMNFYFTVVIQSAICSLAGEGKSGIPTINELDHDDTTYIAYKLEQWALCQISKLHIWPTRRTNLQIFVNRRFIPHQCFGHKNAIYVVFALAKEELMTIQQSTDEDMGAVQEILRFSYGVSTMLTRWCERVYSDGRHGSSFGKEIQDELRQTLVLKKWNHSLELFFDWTGTEMDTSIDWGRVF